MITRYVAGFLFSTDRQRVVLIRKNRPSWQAGKLNGVGGHIEFGETPEMAMEREFSEEVGCAGFVWQPVSVLFGKTFHVHFFMTFTDQIDVRSMTDEQVEIIPLNQLHLHSFVSSLPLMIALALDESGIVKPVQMFDEREAET